MKYVGSRLKEYLRQHRGAYSELAVKMRKYRKSRKNDGNEEYNLRPLFIDGHNVTVYTLTGLMRETGLPLDFFVDFESNELPTSNQGGVSGSNNVINSSISNDLTIKVDHLNEVIRLKDELISDKERIITLKDAEIEQWKKRYDDLIRLTQAGVISPSKT